MTTVHEMTQEGLERLKTELEKLKKSERPKVVKRMAEARELGDLSENADYHDAREQLAFIEGRIQELEAQIKNAKVVSHRASADGAIQMGSRVTVSLKGQSKTYEIVGVNEGDPVAGKVSAESPVGMALMGHKKGETVTVNTPVGQVEYVIKNVE